MIEEIITILNGKSKLDRIKFFIFLIHQITVENRYLSLKEKVSDRVAANELLISNELVHTIVGKLFAEIEEREYSDDSFFCSILENRSKYWNVCLSDILNDAINILKYNK